MQRLLAISVLFAALAQADPIALVERPRIESKWRRVARWSQAALVAGAALDCASSYGQAEANPVMRSGGGQFGAKGVGLKVGAVGAILLTEYLLERRYPETAKALVFLNAPLAAASAGVAVRNWRLR